MAGRSPTTGAFDGLPGWTVLSVPVGRGGARIADHVVVGPPGIFVVVTARRRLGRDRATATRGARRAMAAAAAVAALMPFVPRHQVHPVLSLAGPGSVPVPGCAEVGPPPAAGCEVLVVGEADLAAAMLARPAILPPHHAVALGAALEAEVVPVEDLRAAATAVAVVVGPVAASAPRRTTSGVLSAWRVSGRAASLRAGLGAAVAAPASVRLDLPTPG